MTGAERQTATGAALLEWVNSFPFPEDVASWGELSDGYKIWEILQDIDSSYFDGELPEGPSNSSGKWLLRWQNLKHLSKALVTYITEECDQTIPRGQGSIDIKSIAVDGNKGEIIKLLKLVLLAALNSQKAEGYIQKMPSFSIAAQASLKDIIEEQQEASYPPSDYGTPQRSQVPSPPKPTMDQELLFEERFGRVMADNERLNREKNELQKMLRDLHDRLARLQENNAALQERLIQAEDRLQANGSFRDPHENPLTRELESRLQQQEDLIASQESQLSDYQTSTQALQNTVENLRKSHEKSQNLRDELDEVKAERDNLARKANTVDKYRQKLQASQNLEKENQLLRGELEELRQASTESSQAKQQIIQLELAVDEYRRILPKIEQDRHELQMMKKQLEFDNAAFARKYEAINEQHARDQEMIADLMDKTQGLDSPRTPGAKIGTGLDEELQDGIKARDQVDLDLRAENQDLLQVTNEATTKNLLLQQRIDDITAKHEAFEKKYFETYEENLALTSSLADLEKGSPMESTQVFQKMREQVKAEQKRRADLEAELANLKQQPVSNEARKEDQQRLSEQVSHISLLEAELQALRAQLSQPTEPIDETLIQQVNTALQLENAHLHTELKLMSSAWFDLANRLQMDGMRLQRRSEHPRGWLGRQRQAVGRSSSVRR